MAKNTTKNTISTINQIFDDLDKYRLFCSQYGYYFDEADLYRSAEYKEWQDRRKKRQQWLQRNGQTTNNYRNNRGR